MLQIFTVLLLVIALFESNSSAKVKSRVLLIVKVDSDYNHQYFSKMSVAPTADHSSINADVVIVQNITDSIWLKVAFDMKLPKMTEYRTVFKYDTDGCDLLAKVKREKANLIYIWMNSFLKSSNLPRSCPVLVGTYTWDNFKIDSKGLASFAMDGYYKANFFLYIKRANSKELLTNITTHAVLKVK